MKALAKDNVLLTLPQGTGKTYVSQLGAYELICANAGMKVLVITPTKELRQQYVDMAGWMGTQARSGAAAVCSQHSR